MGITQLMDENYEADDFIGCVAKKFEKLMPTFIYTKDQDAIQLVSEFTRLWMVTSKAEDMYKDIEMELGIRVSENVPKGVFEYTPDLIKEYYGHTPIEIIDFKAIVGDASDGIKGVKGVGDKTALPLIQEFSTIENIYDYIETTSEKEAKEFLKELGISRSPIKKLLEEKESAFLSKKLATIKCDIEETQDVQIDELILNTNENGKIEALNELEMKSLLDKEKEQSA